MEAVHIQFHNIQSHESTQFTLRPGLNFILADENNVGKSTIFRVLTSIARAPILSGNKVDQLIRIGTSKGYAKFELSNDECIVAWFVRGDTPGGAKLFFEYRTSDGDITRSVECPTILLDALGIVVNKNIPINFNDADSIQLIAKTSVEGDAVLTRVMLDDRVEQIKKNLRTLYNETNEDKRVIASSHSLSAKALADTTYFETVDEFDKRNERLGALCAFVDALSSLTETKEVAIDVDAFESLKSDLETYNALLELQTALAMCEELDVQKLEPVRSMIKLMRRLSFTTSYLNDVCGINYKLESQAKEKQRIVTQLRAVTVEVDCPMKGKVLYSDEKCISIDS